MLVTAGFAVAALVYYGQGPIEAVAPAATVPTPSEATITVHVSGAVAAPGLVEVAPTARVADVIAAAGGATADAAPGSINLAAAVRDGEQVVVPAAGTGQVGPVDDGLVRVNSATAAELEEIPGVGPVLAGRIVAAREDRGGFATVEDLLDVAGIGEAKLASLRPYVVIP